VKVSHIGDYYTKSSADINAWLTANMKLTAAQILAHYQNGTNANRTTPYAALVQSHNPTAYLRLGEVAPNSGGVVNVVHKSGTNSLHGSVFEYLRNSALDTPGYFDGVLKRHFSIMSCHHYPVLKEPPLPGQLRTGAHTDYGAMTLLAKYDGDETQRGFVWSTSSRNTARARRRRRSPSSTS